VAGDRESDLEVVNRKLGLARVIDLSATPFFLRGSGYAEGTLFPWTMSDFSLMDAIECGIVKLPRVPVAENIPGDDMPMFRNLWENIRKDMPRKGRGKAGGLDPLALPTRLQTALQALYGHYEKTFALWEQEKIAVPPCFIVVCNNTSTSKLVGPTITRNAGIIGEAVDLSLDHLEDTRTSTLLFHLTHRLLYTKWRDAGEPPKLHLFGQLKRITREWLEGHLVCKGGTYPAQLMYQELADMACNRITAAITAAFADERPMKGVLDSYNPLGSTSHVRFNTSRPHRWQTDPARCHVNWVVLDSDWEAEFCRVAESHPRVKAYVKNHNLGLEVPYRYGSETRRYLPDFIVLVDDGHGESDPLHLVVEIKGYRREDAKEKKTTMDTYWVPGVNNLRTLGRWAFAELTEIYQIDAD
jgi:Endonuclease domain